MHPVKVNTLRHNVVPNKNKHNSNNIFQPICMWLSTVERVSSVLARGFPKRTPKGKVPIGLPTCPLAIKYHSTMCPLGVFS